MPTKLNSSDIPGGFFFIDASIVSGSQVALVGSTSFQIGMFVIPWFLVLYSYVVAKDVIARHIPVQEIGNRDVDTLVHSLLKGTWQDLLLYLEWLRLPKREKQKQPGKAQAFIAVRMAATGLLISLLFL